jgi:hypothetical protein
MQLESIERWLSDLGRDRHWFAEKLGTSKHTVDGWFAGRNIPKSKLIAIEALMRGASQAARPFTVSFTTDEFEEIEQARAHAGFGSREEFYHEAVIQLAREILEKEMQSKVHHISNPPSMVAQRSTKTGTGKRGG